MTGQALPGTPRFVVFDFDGVLADTVRAWFSIVVEELRAAGAEITLEAAMATHRGMVLAESARLYEREHGITLPPDWADRVVARAIPEVERRFSPVPGAVDAVRAVAGAGLPVAVASGSLRHAVASGLARLGLDRIIGDRLASSHDDGRHKPLPDVYIRACRLLGQEARHGLAVEDSPTGVASAHAAGLTVIGYAEDGGGAPLLEAGARVVIGRMADLPAVLSLDGRS